MHFHILGAGAIGLWTGYHLRRHGHRVTLLLRSEEAVAAFRQLNSIRLVAAHDGSGRVSEATDVEAEVATRIRSPIDRLMVTTKAHQTSDAFADVHRWLTEHSSVILLQNGMGVREQLLERYYQATAPMPRFAHGITSMGCMRAGVNEVVHTGNGLFCFGPASDEQAEQASDNLRGTLVALHELALDPDYPSPVDAATIHVHMLAKLAVNACINPVTALLGCSNGQLYEQPYGRSMLTDICSEVARLLRVATSGTSPPAAPFHFPPFTAAQKATFDDAALLQRVLAVCGQTAGNRSSMLVDIEAGRTTEIDFINGYLVRLGQALNCATPLNSLLQKLVHTRTSISNG
ncbi:ketopantoate reductase PanE/ApbA C terminal-domain-containing protein [Syncephalis pseudoplumigaleata]|uniref:2-dehydropantoate 2-reductase n=1 Tax=Syncephalis pseudoplumigaleata TaxID=1712513 RepID=A0A4P9Z3F2_9FUNG|nr:ketopantoate reductase PanE/ApbA C terminal-domain-containing protein [Syncephalis pseudoplumigaleata]|eukprot:RKP26040.1 ketopantoate reductase PanE/ApbA C terminal-domain-containing protein [Syncephalis pseudoplumigaleata]